MVAVTTKQAAIDNLNAIASLILQSPEAQIQEIVNKVGDQVSQLRQIDQQQDARLSTLDQQMAEMQASLQELPQLGEAETQRVLELIAENHPEIAQITLPTVSYRGESYALADFVTMVAQQEGKKPIDYSEATYTPEGYLSSVLVKYDDRSQETVTLTMTEADNGETAIYIGQVPDPSGPLDAYEWHIKVSHIQSSLLQLDIKRHTDISLMRLIGTSHLINWSGGAPVGDESTGGDTPGSIPADEPGDDTSIPDGLQDVPLSPLAGGFSSTKGHQTDAMGNGFVNFAIYSEGLYRVAVTNAIEGASYAVVAAGEAKGSLVADSNGNAAGVIALRQGDTVSVTAEVNALPFSAGIVELDQGLEPGDGEPTGEPPAAG